MIGNTFPKYVVIQTSILMIRAVTPLSILYIPLRLFVLPPLPILTILDIWAGAETLFFVSVFLPLSAYSQRKATHPPLGSRSERQELFERCVATIPDKEAYSRRLFKNAPLSEIRRENVKQFFRWAFLGTTQVNQQDDEELEGYVEGLEQGLQRPFAPGFGDVSPLRLTLDPVFIWHRPLIWYMIISGVDFYTFLYFRLHGFALYRPSPKLYPQTFPFRPFTLNGRKSPVSTLSYWYRPSSNPNSTRPAILFLHGIGVGLWTYTSFFNEVTKAANDDVTILAIELLPISSRITQATLDREQLIYQMKRILDHHNLDNIILMSHSFGSTISTMLVKSPLTRHLITSMILVDPVSVLLHLPDVMYNFIYRKPRHASEHQLYYFASTDMGVAHTLSRKFFWYENILWKEDLVRASDDSATPSKDISVSAFLAGIDLIVNTQDVAKYLTDDQLDKCVYLDKGRVVDYGDGDENMDGNMAEPVKVFINENLDHADIFDSRATRDALTAEVIRHLTIAE